MSKTYINPLSAHGQFKSISEVTLKLKDLSDALYYILPAVQKKRISVIYDSTIEIGSLINGENFAQVLNNVRRSSEGKDLVTRWFLFVKKYCIDVSEGMSNLTIHTDRQKDVIAGLVGSEMFMDDTILLSLGGSPLTEDPFINVSDGHSSIRLCNAYSLDSLYPLTPRYEASEKHRLDPYFVNGVEVSAMPLNKTDAQTSLLQGISFQNDLWALREECGRYFRFKRTHIDRLIYHGFQVRENEVPQNVRTSLNEK